MANFIVAFEILWIAMGAIGATLIWICEIYESGQQRTQTTVKIYWIIIVLFLGMFGVFLFLAGLRAVIDTLKGKYI